MNFTFLLHDCLISSTSSSLLSISLEWVWRKRSISISRRSLAWKKNRHYTLCSHCGLKEHFADFQPYFHILFISTQMSTVLGVVLCMANKLWHLLVVEELQGVRLRKTLLSPFLSGRITTVQSAAGGEKRFLCTRRTRIFMMNIDNFAIHVRLSWLLMALRSN